MQSTRYLHSPTNAGRTHTPKKAAADIPGPGTYEMQNNHGPAATSTKKFGFGGRHPEPTTDAVRFPGPGTAVQPVLQGQGFGVQLSPPEYAADSCAAHIYGYLWLLRSMWDLCIAHAEVSLWQLGQCATSTQCISIPSSSQTAQISALPVVSPCYVGTYVAPSDFDPAVSMKKGITIKGREAIDGRAPPVLP